MTEQKIKERPDESLRHAASDKMPKEISFGGAALIALICVIFGGNTVAIKLCLEGFGVFAFAGFRFLIAAGVIFLWAKATGRSLKLKRKDFKPVFIVTAVFSAQFSFFVLGVSQTSASRAALLVNLQPFCVLILAHFFIAGDRMTLRKFIGMAIGFCGVASIFIFNDDATMDFRSGDVFVLITALLWGCNAVYFKSFIGNRSVFVVTFYHLLFSTPFFFIMSFFFDDAMILTITFKTAVAFFYQAVISAGFGFIVWNAMQKRYKASAVHSFLFIMPVSGVFLSAFFLKEPLSANIMAALFLIAPGILISQYQRKTAVEKPLPGH